MKKLLSCLLIMSFILVGSTTYSASSSQDITNPSNSTDINVSINDYGTIIVPKNIIVAGNSATSVDYTITASGSIAGDHVVNVTMPASITLEQGGKDNVVCTITNNNTYNYFVDSDYNGSISGVSEDAPKLNGSDTLNYTIDVSNVSAGTWSGTMNIVINIEDKVL